MAEQTAQTSTDDKTEKTVETSAPAKFTEYTGHDPLAAPLLAALNAQVQSYKELSARLSAADGDRDKAIQSWIETTTNDKAVAIRRQMETLTAKLQELAEKNVVTETLSEDDKSKLTTERDSLRDNIRTAIGSIRDISKSLGKDPEGVAKCIDLIGDPTRVGRGRKPGVSSGSNLPRVSATLSVVGGNFTADKPEVFESFSKAALGLNADVADMQKAFAEAAGVSHAEISSVKDSVTFDFTPHVNGSTFTITTTPKSRNKPGPKVDGKSETVAQPAAQPVAEATPASE